MNDRHFALSSKNLLWIGIGFVIIILGFLLMLGAPSTKEAYNPDIFSTRRLIIAPTIAFTGFIVVMVGILLKPKETNEESNKGQKA